MRKLLPVFLVTMLVLASPFGGWAQAPAGAHLTYYGGPVVSNAHVVMVVWGSGVSSSITNTMPGLYDVLSESSAYRKLSFQ